MKQEELLRFFIDGDIRYIGKSCGSLSIGTDYDSDNITLLSYGTKIAYNHLGNDEITLMGWADYHSATTTTHIRKLKFLLYNDCIGYSVNCSQP